MMQWILFGLLLVLQNASFTFVSRARNSGSLLLHAVAAIGSNGIYIFVIQKVIEFQNNNAGWRLTVTYIIGTVIGSLLMHWAMMRYLSGKAKVGG